VQLPQLPQDKANHALYGASIYLVAALFVGPLLALGLSCVAGALKEVYDRLHKDAHTPDAWDWLATTAGGLVCFAAHLIN
jgi:hypothetical protein